MNTLTKMIIQRIPNPVFSVRELAVLESGSDDVRHAKVKRAIADGDLIHIRRGLYTLSPLYRKTTIHPFALAQIVYGPSYITLETALSAHGWIPEGVREITSVTARPSRDFHTPIGHFSYRRIPQNVLYSGVNFMHDETGQAWMLASPLKALADYVYLHKLNWASMEPLLKSLRVEEEQLLELTTEDFTVLEANYTSRRVNLFLAGLKKELAR